MLNKALKAYDKTQHTKEKRQERMIKEVQNFHANGGMNAAGFSYIEQLIDLRNEGFTNIQATLICYLVNLLKHYTCENLTNNVKRIIKDLTKNNKEITLEELSIIVFEELNLNSLTNKYIY